jgi:hypothetical protein
MPHGFKNWRLIICDLYQSYVLLSNSASVLAKGEGRAYTISAGIIVGAHGNSPLFNLLLQYSNHQTATIFSSVLLPRLLRDYGRKILVRTLRREERLGARFLDVPTVKPFFQLVPSKQTVVIRIEHP